MLLVAFFTLFSEKLAEKGGGLGLLVAGYWLLVAGYWLLVAGCWFARLRRLPFKNSSIRQLVNWSIR
jgi:hypothetical protein